MRLFAAIELPEAVRADLARRLPQGPRYVAQERWHLTLAFYGELAEPAAADLATRLARAARRAAPLHLAVAGGGSFRTPGGRVVWCGLCGDLPELTRLAAAAAAAGRRAGVAPERRAFRPHVTLARLRGAGRGGARAEQGQVRRVLAALSDYRGPAWTADRLVLARSHLGPQPRYEDFAAFPLGRGGEAMIGKTGAD